MFIGINPTEQGKNITLFRKLQSTHFSLMTIAWSCHWNIVGAGFHANHEFLKELYEKEQDRVDACAERVRALNGTCPFTTSEMGDLSLLPELQPEQEFTTDTVFNTVADSWATVIKIVRDCRSQISEVDYASAAFLDNMLEEMEKELWMLLSSVNNR